jgi:hypothetical protein
MNFISRVPLFILFDDLMGKLVNKKSFRACKRFTSSYYPHFESEDQSLIAIFISRHLVDYFSLIFDVTDNLDFNNLLKLIRIIFGTKFTVLLNYDKFLMQKRDNKVEYTSMDELNSTEDEIYKKIEAKPRSTESTRRIF